MGHLRPAITIFVVASHLLHVILGWRKLNDHLHWQQRLVQLLEISSDYIKGLTTFLSRLKTSFFWALPASLQACMASTDALPGGIEEHLAWVICTIVSPGLFEHPPSATQTGEVYWLWPEYWGARCTLGFPDDNRMQHTWCDALDCWIKGPGLREVGQFSLFSQLMKKGETDVSDD